MSDVFVSYKAEDRRRVRPLVDALQADGYSIWWDEQIGGGAAWRHTIEAELDAARCVVVVWSKHSISPDGAFVQDEATRAQRRHVYLPVSIDKVRPPLGFGEIQTPPLTGWRGGRSDPRYQAVLAAVRRMIGGDATAIRLIDRRQVGRRAVLAGGAVVTAAAAGVGGWILFKPRPGADDDSIAVLPFANLSGQPSQAYFSDGIAEEIRSALARIAGLKVVGRTSSEAVRNDDAKTAASKLRVVSILTGSVRQSASTVRISAELTDGRTGLDRWSQTYDRPLGDSIKIQTDIAENVARTLSIALGSAAEAAIVTGGTSNAEAQDLVLRADELLRVRTQERHQRAIQLLDSAIRLDPNYADAYARKAVVVRFAADLYSDGPDERDRGRAEALSLASRAIALAPRLPRAHLALAQLHMSNLNIGAALPEFSAALRLGGGDPGVLRSYSSFISLIGNADEAIAVADRVVRLDPFDPRSYSNRALVLSSAHRFADVIRDAEKLKRESPELFDFSVILGDCLFIEGRLKEAQAAYAQAPADDPLRLTGEAFIRARLGQRAATEQILARMREMFGDAMSYAYAEIYSVLGDRERAFAALDRAWSIRDPALLGLRIDPTLDPVRGDPRFAVLLRKMNFPG